LTQCSHQSESSGVTNEGGLRSRRQPLPTASVELSVFNSSIPAFPQGQGPPHPTTENHFIVMHSMSTWAAFFCIANLLQLECMHDTGFNICALTYTLPPAMAPTLQQQLIPHKPYVDMLPWSSLRDRILNSITTINEIEFVLDLGDLKVWGSTPWDPTGWEVGPGFARKWWFLIDDKMLQTTNFWRSQRGEEALVLAPP
jgi:hypothetical protein